MKISKNYRDTLVEEISIVQKKMTSEKNFNKRNYFFSAIYAQIQRTYNFEFNTQLVFMHQVLQNSYRLIQERLVIMGTGNQVIMLDEKFWVQLDKYLSELRLTLKKKEDNIYPILEKITCLAYASTGNGGYLKEKGIKLY